MNHLRVVVHINAPDETKVNDINNNNFNDCNVGTPQSSANCKKSKFRSDMVSSPSSPPIPTSLGHTQAEVLVIDEKSLHLKLRETEAAPYTYITHKMSFDYVSYANVDFFKEQLYLVVNELIQNRLNCCIMRFTVQHKIDIAFFYDILVMLIDKRLQQLKYKLQYCKLECNDITAASDIPESLSPLGFTMNVCVGGLKSSPRFSRIKSSPRFSGLKCLRNTRNQFRNTRELLLWLLNEYRTKMNEITGHEKLIFTFSVLDEKKKMFTINLYLYNIYLNLMSSKDLNHWHHYMSHLSDGCQGQNCEFMHSGLTISLTRHLEAKASNYGLLLFDVPNGGTMTTETVDMLQLAHSVFNIRNKKRSAQYNDFVFPTVVHGEKNNFIMESIKDDNKDIQNMSNEKRKSLSLDASVAFIIPLNEKKKTTSPTLQCVPLKNEHNNTMNNVNYSNLSTWYHKIDSCFQKVCQARNEYYNNYFDGKRLELIESIKNILPTLSNVDLGVEKNLNESKIYEQYRLAANTFNKLSRDIINTSYESNLRVYLDTKIYELDQKVAQTKIELFEECKEKIFSVFQNELIALRKQVFHPINGRE